MDDEGIAVIPNQGALQDLTEKKTLLSTLHKIGLYKSTFVPTADSVLADYLANVCDFGGYTPQLVAIDASPGVGSAGIPFLPLNSVVFATDDGDPIDTAGGWFLYGLTTAPVKVRYSGQFSQPVVFNAPLQQIRLDIALRENGQTTWEASN